MNSIHELPYLPLIELAILAVPILIHGIWGIVYLRQAKYNSFGSGVGAVPYLPEYPRNRAYTWQRITSWLLLVGIIAHVVHMRFVEYPLSAVRGIGKNGIEHSYLVRITEDNGLYTLSKRLGVELYDAASIQALAKKQFKAREKVVSTTGKLKAFFNSLGSLFVKKSSMSEEPSQEGMLAVQKRQIQSE